MRPLAGRRLWFVGIGGAGMSALALVAKEWGAEVGGSDRARSSYVERLEAAGIHVAIGHDAANVPEGAEIVVSSAIAADNPEVAHARVKRRAELLAELVELRPSAVVAGAHGKTTTTAMIAFVLDRLGRDPAFLIGGDIPQLGGNARAGGGWLVAEGDESDRSLELLRPRLAVLTNVELDHHATFVSEAEVRELFEDWLARAPTWSPSRASTPRARSRSRASRGTSSSRHSPPSGRECRSRGRRGSRTRCGSSRGARGRATSC